MRNFLRKNTEENITDLLPSIPSPPPPGFLGTAYLQPMHPGARVAAVHTPTTTLSLTSMTQKKWAKWKGTSKREWLDETD